MVLSLLTVLNTNLEQMVRVNELSQYVNEVSDGASNVANTSIVGTLFKISSNTPQLVFNTSGIAIDNTLTLALGPLATQVNNNDTSTSNIASANLVNSVRQLTRTSFDRANAANLLATDAWGATSNLLITVASAYDKANAANVLAFSAASGGAAFDRANLGLATAQSAFTLSNTVNLIAIFAADQANTAYGRGNTAYTHANAAYIQANLGLTFGATIFGAANTAYTHANNAYAKANTLATTSSNGIVELATDAEIWAANSGTRVITTASIASSSANVALTDSANVQINWSAGHNFSLVVTAARPLANPSNPIPGTGRTVEIRASTGTSRDITFGNAYGGDIPTVRVTNVSRKLVSLWCIAPNHFLVTGVVSANTP